MSAMTRKRKRAQQSVDLDLRVHADCVQKCCRLLSSACNVTREKENGIRARIETRNYRRGVD